MNQALMRGTGMRGTGMRGLGLGPPIDWEDDWPSGSSPTSNGGAPPWWAILGPSIITTAGTVTRDVFAPTGTAQAAYGAQYRTQARQYTPDELALILRQQQQYPNQGIGASLESFVRNNSTLLLIGVGLFALVQMPGFTRRGR